MHHRRAVCIVTLALMPLAASFAAENKNETVDTSRLIELLETAELESIATTHSQWVFIGTADGKRYQGKYVAKEGKYPKITDALNLVVHIVHEKRGLKNIPIAAE